MNREAMVDRLASAHVGATNTIDAEVWLYQAYGKFTMNVNFTMPVGMVSLDTLGDYVKDYGRSVYGIDSDLQEFFKKRIGPHKHTKGDWVTAESKVVGFKSRTTYVGNPTEDFSGKYNELFSELVKLVGPRADLTLRTLDT